MYDVHDRPPSMRSGVRRRKLHHNGWMDPARLPAKGAGLYVWRLCVCVLCCFSRRYEPQPQKRSPLPLRRPKHPHTQVALLFKELRAQMERLLQAGGKGWRGGCLCMGAGWGQGGKGGRRICGSYRVYRVRRNFPTLPHPT